MRHQTIHSDYPCCVSSPIFFVVWCFLSRYYQFGPTALNYKIFSEVEGIRNEVVVA